MVVNTLQEEKTWQGKGNVARQNNIDSKARAEH